MLAGLGDGALHLFELSKRRHTGFVGHHVLAGLHGSDGQARAVTRDRSDADDVDRRIGENRLAVDL